MDKVSHMNVFRGWAVMNSVHFLTSQSKRNTVDFFSLENQTELQEMRARLSNLQEQLREKDDKLREKEGINLSLQ